MEILANFFSISIILGLLFSFLSILAIWLFIRSAIKSGVKQGIINAYEEIEFKKKNPVPTQEELFKKEMDNWK